VCIRDNITFTSCTSEAGDVLCVLLQDVTGSGRKWQLRMADALCLGGYELFVVMCQRPMSQTNKQTYYTASDKQREHGTVPSKHCEDDLR